jgi:hypothetical protein
LSKAETAARKDVRVRTEQWLEGGFATTKCIEADAFVVEVDFGANQPMRPVLGHRKVMTEDRGKATIVGTTDENDCAARPSLKIEHEILRHWAAWGSAFDAHGCPAPFRATAKPILNSVNVLENVFTRA